MRRRKTSLSYNNPHRPRARSRDHGLDSSYRRKCRKTSREGADRNRPLPEAQDSYRHIGLPLSSEASTYCWSCWQTGKRAAMSRRTSVELFDRHESTCKILGKSSSFRLQLDSDDLPVNHEEMILQRSPGRPTINNLTSGIGVRKSTV